MDKAQSKLLMQCPGCWSFDLCEPPSGDRYVECECGEVWQVIDLRDPDVWTLRMGAPQARS